MEENRRRNSTTLSGEQAFQLHDTYGFPIDLTLEMAAEQGLTVDEEGFRRLMAEQRERAKRDAAEKKTGNADISAFAEMLERSGAVTFTGYDQISGEATILGLLVNGVPVPAAGAGTEVDVVLDRTPFYAEGGGQLADAGTITVAGGEITVSDVQTPLPGLIVHRGKVTSGEVTVDMPAFAEIDVERRRALSRSHTATHLVHRALRGALGESAAQAGSENAPGRLRFDFTAQGAVPLSVLRDTEDEVNEVLVNDLDVHAFYTSQEEAREMGALALFGEKYGDQVRVVEVGEYSRELCGGTHVARSGQLGLIKVLGESSIGSGVRRIEALVGIDAFRFLARESVLVSQLSEQLKTPREQLPERISGVVSRLREAERELQRLRAARLLESAGQIAAECGGHQRDGPGRAPGAGRDRSPTTSASSRSTCAAGCRAGGPRWWWSSACPRTSRSWSSRSTRRAAVSACRRVPWSGWRRGPSAATAAGSRTWPRAAAPPSRTATPVS